MKRRRYIAWVLMLVSMVMLTAAVLPHHHHQHILCLHNDVTACECDCGENKENHAAESHHACEDHCVTNFQSVTPDEAQGDVSPDYSTCQLLYTLADILSIPLPLEDKEGIQHSCYLEKLHATCHPHVMGLRAPPVV